jgi:hypothetical protein
MRLKFALALSLVLNAISCRSLNTGAGGDLKARACPVQISELAPDFSLDDQNGKKVRLSAVRVNAPTILAFYRGNW